jgi:hypothetical protein
MVWPLRFGGRCESLLTIYNVEALQNEMVILRAPPPEPPVVASDGEDDLSHLSESEIRRLAIERLRDNKVSYFPTRRGWNEWPIPAW